jgi:hypothetical protein
MGGASLRSKLEVGSRKSEVLNDLLPPASF